MKKIILLFVLGFCFSIFPHKEGTHQYMVREAYKVLKNFKGEVPEMLNHLGSNQQGNGMFNPGGIIVAGAYEEDHSDATFEGFGFGGWMVSNTHFWNPDLGDNSRNTFGTNSYSNAYTKANKYIYGGYELRVPYSNGIFEAYNAPANLFEFYKTGIIYYKGYYNILGQFIPRNRWVTSPRWFIDKIFWDIIGRVCHLIGDITVPAHVFVQAHDGIVDPSSEYEEYMGADTHYQLWTYQNAINQGAMLDPSSQPNPLKYIFYTTSQITQFFPGRQDWLGGGTIHGNSTNGSNDVFSLYPGLQEFMSYLHTTYGILGAPENGYNQQISDNAFVYGIRAISGFLYWTAKQCSLDVAYPPLPLTLATPQCLENPAFTTNYIVNGTNVGSSWSGILQQLTVFNVTVVIPTGYEFLEWNDHCTDISRVFTYPFGGTFSYFPKFKKILSSSDINAFSSNQKRFFKNIDGSLHLIYESGGNVWYQFSSDNGATWKLGNNKSPLFMDGETVKNPSLDYINLLPSVFEVLVVAQKKIFLTGLGYTSGIMFVKLCKLNKPDGTWDMVVNDGYDFPKENIMEDGLYDNTNLYPSVCLHGSYNDFVLTFSDYHNQYLPLFSAYTGYSGHITWYIGDPYYYTQPNETIVNLSINSTKPFKVMDRADEFPWFISAEIKNSVTNTSRIFLGKYRHNWDDDYTIYTDFTNDNFSLNSGFTTNSKPVVIGVGVSPNESARVCWVGSRTSGGGVQGKIKLPKTESTSSIISTTVFKSSDNTTRLWNFGTGVNSAYINLSNDCYTIGWARSNSDLIQFTDSYTLQQITNVSGLYGSNVQICNGGPKTDMRAMAFNTSSSPYSFNSGQLYSGRMQIGKIVSQKKYNGREGIISKNNTQFYFTLGDINVNGTDIDFVDINDSVKINTLQNLNNYTVSKSFRLSDNSKFYYSVDYGVINSSTANQILSSKDSIKFTVELVDSLSGKVIGIYDNITFSQENAFQFNKLGYNVNTQGIGNRIVYLRLKIHSNVNGSYSLTDKIAFENISDELSLQQNFDGSLDVKSYSLEQNYPNPFNPSTTISYQIPKAGFVTLKIYDILGKEMISLVDEYKPEGKYTKEFSANRLASGIYLYVLKVNDFTSCKKMVFLK